MRRPSRFRPALEQLEDRWCPSYTVSFNGGPYMPIPTPGGTNAVGGGLGVIDNDPSATLSFLYQGSGTWQVMDTGTTPTPTTTFTGVTGLLAVSMGGTQDTLVIDGSVDTLGLNHGPLNSISVALDGTAPGGMPNSFTFKNIDLNNNANPATSTLYVLGQGANNNVNIGDNIHFARTVIANILYRDAANGSNPGTLNNGVNNTTLQALYINGLVYNSQSAFSTDHLVVGAAAAPVHNYGDASINLPDNGNPSTVALGAGEVGISLTNTQLNVHGVGSGGTVTLGDVGGDALTVYRTAFIDADTSSGGAITVYNNVDLKAAATIDDFASVSIDPNGGSLDKLEKGLTIWSGTGGTAATLGGTAGGVITGDVTFNTGVIGGDSDDGTVSAGTTNSLTLAVGEILAGNLTANLNTTTDTVDVEGSITKSLNVKGTNGTDTVLVGTTPGATASVAGSATLNLGNANFDTVTIGTSGGSTATITGNSTINEGSGSSDTITINKTATFSHNLVIGLGNNGSQSIFFDGSVGAGPASATVLTVNAGTGASVGVEFGGEANISGSARLNLTQDASNLVLFDAATTGVFTGTVFAFGNGPANSFIHIDASRAAHVFAPASEWTFF